MQMLLTYSTQFSASNIYISLLYCLQIEFCHAVNYFGRFSFLLEEAEEFAKSLKTAIITFSGTWVQQKQKVNTNY